MSRIDGLFLVVIASREGDLRERAEHDLASETEVAPIPTFGRGAVVRIKYRQQLRPNCSPLSGGTTSRRSPKLQQTRQGLRIDTPDPLLEEASEIGYEPGVSILGVSIGIVHGWRE
jgi:hypothetical protein